MCLLARNFGLQLNSWLGPPSVGCGHKIVLSKNMSYGRTCFSGIYAFQDDMCYKSICVEGGHALLYEMSYGRSCIGGVHVFRMAYLTIFYVLLKDMSYWKSCLLEGMYWCCIGLTGVWPSHLSWEYVLWEDTCSRWACLAGLCRSNQLSCCEFRHMVVFFLSTLSFVCFETCFPRIYCLNIFLVYISSFMWSLGWL